MNFNITARSKDGHPITVAVRLKGEAGSEVSILYGSAGDPDLSRDLLDKAEASAQQARQGPGAREGLRLEDRQPQGRRAVSPGTAARLA